MSDPESDRQHAGQTDPESSAAETVCAAEDVVRLQMGEIDRPVSPVVSETNLGVMTVSRLECERIGCSVLFAVTHDGNWGNPQLNMNRSAGKCALAR